MGPKERIESQPERAPVKVKLGEPFTVSPRLDSVKHLDEETSLIDEINLEIEGIGMGSFGVYRKRNMEDISADKSIGFKTPAGSIEIKHILDNARPKFVERSSPLYFKISIDRLTEEQLERVKCELIFENELFEGDPYFDNVELEQEGKADLTFNIWVDPETREKYILWLPPNKPEVFEKMQFLIKKKE